MSRMAGESGRQEDVFEVGSISGRGDVMIGCDPTMVKGDMCLFQAGRLGNGPSVERRVGKVCDAVSGKDDVIEVDRLVDESFQMVAAKVLKSGEFELDSLNAMNGTCSLVVRPSYVRRTSGITDQARRDILDAFDVL